MNAGQARMKPLALLCDTNIWVSYHLGFEDEHEAARALVLTARNNDIRLGIALHSLSNVFYLIHRNLKRMNRTDPKIPPERASAAAKEAAWGVVNNIMEYAEVVGADGSDARIAALHKAVHDDFEDDLVFAAARRMGADLIVSNDLALIKHSPLPALTAEDALKWMRA